MQEEESGEPSNSKSDYRYWAFISYSHKDEKWGKWLHQNIENYRGHTKLMGSTNRRGEPIPMRLFPVFRDREELEGSPSLPDRIQQALSESRYQIVICSPQSAKSKWVNEEIKAFKRLNREDHVLALIVDGEPNATDDPAGALSECFPEALRYRIGADGNLSDERTEPIAADCREGKDGKVNALLKIAAPLLGVRFDDLRQRDQERRRRKLRLWIASLASLALIFLGLAIYAFLQKGLAEERARIARSRQLAIQSSRDLPTRSSVEKNHNFALAVLEAVHAVRLQSTFEACSSLLSSLLISLYPPQFLWGGQDLITSIAFSPDGRILASGSRDKTVILWDVAQRRPLGKPLRGHEGLVSHVTFSPDGKILASASWGFDQTVFLWDVAKNQPLGEPLRGHRLAVHSVAFSPDGKILASASEDKTVRLWDVNQRKPLGEPLMGHVGALYGVVFSPDGKFLAAWGNTLTLWDVARRRPVGKPLTCSPTGYAVAMYSVAFSPDGRLLAFGNQDMSIILWDVSQRKAIGKPLKGHKGALTSIVFSPDGKFLASASTDKTVALWDISKQKQLKILEIPRAHWNYVVFRPDGKLLAYANTEDSYTTNDKGIIVTILNADGGQARSTQLIGHPDAMHSVASSSDGRLLASGDGASTIILWDVAQLNPVPLGEQINGSAKSLAFSPDGRLLAAAGDNQRVTLWDVAQRKPLSDLLGGHEGRTTSVAFSPNGKLLASASEDKTVRLWDVQTGQPVGDPLRGHEGSVLRVVFSPDGRFLISVDHHETLILWDVAHRKPLGAPINGPNHEVVLPSSIALSPDGKLLAFIDGFQTVTLWDVARRKPYCEPLKSTPDDPGGPSGLGSDGLEPLGEIEPTNESSVAFSPDGELLAYGDYDGQIILWDIAQRQPVGRPLIGHQGAAWAVAFSPDGKLLASGGSDKTVILWDVTRRKPLGDPLIGHEGAVSSIVFSPDGKLLASASEDKKVILWDIERDSWIKRACHMANRNLSHKEWREIVGTEVDYEPACPGLSVPED